MVLLLQYLVAGVVARRNPLRALWTMLPAYLVGWGCCSSAATLPYTLRQTKKNGVSSETADLVIPLCANVHLAGSMANMVVYAAGLLLLMGETATFGAFTEYILMISVIAVASPGVPGGVVLASAAVAEAALGFTAERYAIMIAVYMALDGRRRDCADRGPSAPRRPEGRAMTEAVFSTWGALAGLAVAIVLIVRRATPAYALVLGALAGGLLGGGGLPATVAAMISGTQAMMPSVLRILVSGVLVGALVKTGSAAKIADAVVAGCGSRFALAAVALATLIVTAVGVFVDIAVITVAPVALAIGRRADIPVPALLLAMIGGGKAGNVISPNPNTIAVAEAFHIDLTTLIAANIIPAACAFGMTVLLSTWLARKRTACATTFSGAEVPSDLPSLGQAVSGPVVVVALLSLRPICGVMVDPLVALPAGGLVSILVCGCARQTVAFAEFGLGKVAGVSILLVGTGTIAGIIKASGLNGDVNALLHACHLPVFALAPVSGLLFSGATASTVAGVTIASQTFASTLVSAGVPTVSAAAMLHAGGTVFDALPHGSFFHATAGAVGMGVRDRLRLFPYGEIVGATTMIASTLVYLIMR